MHANEGELIRKAVLGDADALVSLLETCGPPIAAGLSIAPKWRSMVTPEDVMQVTYLEAFLRITDFVPSGPDSFRPWLARIAENNLRDAVRELGRDKRPPPDRRLTTPEDRSYVDLILLLSGGGATPSGAAATREAVGLVQAAVDRLPEDYRRVVRLYELQGLSIHDVAADMGRSEGAVKMLLARARDRLRESLGSSSRYFSAGS
jgi:RNA polymerase sigma-70 factor (ECF subfamily)